MVEDTKKEKRLSLYRYINTNIWKDSKFEELSINEKLLFLYALTNGSTNLCGAYEISKKTIAFETGIEINELNKCFKALENKKMVKYDNDTNEMYVVNFLKYNVQGEKNEKNALKFYGQLKSKLIKEEILAYMKNNFICPIDTPYIGHTYPIDDREKSIENSDKRLDISGKPLDISGKPLDISGKRLLVEREKGKEKKFEKRKGEGEGVEALNVIELDEYAQELKLDINVVVNAYDELKNNDFISENGELINTKQDLKDYFMLYGHY